MDITPAGASLIATFIPFALLIIVIEARRVWPRAFLLGLVVVAIVTIGVCLGFVALWNCFIVVNSGAAATKGVAWTILFSFIWLLGATLLLLLARLVDNIWKHAHPVMADD